MATELNESDKYKKEEKVKVLLSWMQTEEYYKTHGGNGPNWKEGGELIKEYGKAMDDAGIERRDTLVVKYNKILNANLLRRVREQIHTNNHIEMNITLQDIIDCKTINDDVYNKELDKIINYEANENKYSLCGNKTIYHHQLKNLLKHKQDIINHFTSL